MSVDCIKSKDHPRASKLFDQLRQHLDFITLLFDLVGFKNQATLDQIYTHQLNRWVWLARSITIAESAQYRYGQVFSLINMAGVYNTLKKNDSAIESLMKSLEIINEIQNNTPEAIQWKNQTMNMALDQLSTAYRDLGDVKKADEYKQQSNNLITK